MTFSNHREEEEQEEQEEEEEEEKKKDRTYKSEIQVIAVSAAESSPNSTFFKVVTMDGRKANLAMYYNLSSFSRQVGCHFCKKLKQTFF